jgi:hypothetical protein
MFGPKKEKIKEDWRELHKEFHKFRSSQTHSD